VESSRTTSSFYGDERFVQPEEMAFGELLRRLAGAGEAQEGQGESKVRGSEKQAGCSCGQQQPISLCGGAGHGRFGAVFNQ
jgi:hypothetical protein